MFWDHRPVRVPLRPPSAATYTLILFAFIAATRWPLAPAYLYYFDSANFALAMERFNPALHQPQPPGYPLFVGLLRLIHIWIAPAQQVMLIAGLIAACAATLLIFLLVSDMFGRKAAILSAALLASNPVFWFGGITNQVRLFLALGALGVALLSWRALRRPAEPRALYMAFAALGIAGGFRTVEAVLLLPLLLWVWYRTGHSVRRLVCGGLSLIAAAMPSVAAVTWAVGGVHGLIDMLWGYANAQFEGSCIFFGASFAAAYQMFTWAVVWNLLGSISWIWAAPFVGRKWLRNTWGVRAAFLAVWFVPIFLFSALIHIGDPDQALGSVPVLCIAGGVVLARFLDRKGSDRVFTAAALIVVSHVLIFFYPPGKIAKASSYRAAAAVDRMTARALQSIELLRSGKPVTIVHFGSSVASRQIEYYFPDDYVLVLFGDPRKPAVEQPPMAFYHHTPVLVQPGTTLAMHPLSRRLICLAPFGAKPSDLPGWRPFGSVFYKDIGFAPKITIGPYNLIRQ